MLIDRVASIRVKVRCLMKHMVERKMTRVEQDQVLTEGQCKFKESRTNKNRASRSCTWGDSVVGLMEKANKEASMKRNIK